MWAASLGDFIKHKGEKVFFFFCLHAGKPLLVRLFELGIARVVCACLYSVAAIHFTRPLNCRYPFHSIAAIHSTQFQLSIPLNSNSTQLQLSTHFTQLQLSIPLNCSDPSHLIAIPLNCSSVPIPLNCSYPFHSPPFHSIQLTTLYSLFHPSQVH